jgi:hypothetical protein
VLFNFAREAAGATGIRHSLRPLNLGELINAKLGHIVRRECVSARHCEERERRRNPDFLPGFWIASPSLAMTAVIESDVARSSCPAFVPGIHVLLSISADKDVDGRVKPGDDERCGVLDTPLSRSMTAAWRGERHRLSSTIGFARL